MSRPGLVPSKGATPTRSPAQTVLETRDDSIPGPDEDREASADAPEERDAAESPEVPEDGTLGGYMAEHGRPPSFEGSDRHPYTVSVEIEQIGDLRTPWAGYLVFPRWSHGGAEIVGHVQTPLLTRGRSHGDVVDALGELSLTEIKELLEEGIERQRAGDVP